MGRFHLNREFGSSEPFCPDHCRSRKGGLSYHPVRDTHGLNCGSTQVPNVDVEWQKKIAVVLPAYNAEKTLSAMVAELLNCVDVCILVDDHGTDDTVKLARKLGLDYLASLFTEGKVKDV
jgi:hypothetical protein